MAGAPARPVANEPHPTSERARLTADGRLRALGALAVLAAAFFAFRLVFRGRGMVLVNGDVLLYFYPLYETTYARMAAGHLPLWNPYQLCGLPWLATLQGGFFYPGHVLYLLLPTYLALGASTLLHFVLAAVATAVFAREAGLGTAAAMLGGILFTLRGTVANLTLFPNALEAAAWLPVGCLAILRLARGAGASAGALLAVASAASLLAGYPQETVFLAYAWATLLIALLLGSRAGVRRWISRGVWFGSALALGGIAAAIQLLPAAELSRAGARETQQLTQGLMFPMGGAVQGNPAYYYLANHSISGSQFAFGLVGLALLPVAVLARRHRALAGWGIVFGGVTLAFALGPVTPLFRLYMALPALGWFRLPSRIFLLTDYCFALVAAVALDRLGDAVPVAARRRGWPGLIPAAVIATALGLAAFAGVRGQFRAMFLGLLTAGAVAIGARRGVLASIVVVLALVDVFAEPSPGLLRPYSRGADELYGTHAETFQAVAARAGHDRIWLFAPTLMPDFGPKLPTRYRVRAMTDYEPVNLRRQSEYFLYFTNGPLRSPPHFSGDVYSLAGLPRRPSAATRRRLVDLTAMRFMLVPEAFFVRADVRQFAMEAGFVRRPDVAPGIVLLENPHAAPRAFVVYRTLPAPEPDDLLSRLSAPTFDPLVESFVEGDVGIDGAGAPERGEPATFVVDDEAAVELEVNAAAPGLVVLADSFYSGWEATVDGVPAPIVPTNLLFRGVRVPAGNHRVRFEYHPWTVPAGALASAVGVLGIIGLWAWGRRSARAPGILPSGAAADALRP